MSHRVPAPVLVVVALALLIVSCSSSEVDGGDASGRDGGTTPAELASAADEDRGAGTVDGSADGSTGGSRDGSAGGSVPGHSTATLPAEASSDGATPPTTAGSGLAPVTTVPGAIPGDPDGIYIGVIGALGPDQLMTSGVAAAPVARAGVMPLTGLPGDVPDRPAAVVKVDNGSAAAPHVGLNAADLVIEEEVEGGVTRFAAVFHSTPSIVGPVRSGRTTDVALIGGMGWPLLLYSGANEVTDGIIRSQPFIQNRSASTSSGYWRDDSRRAPSNLFTDTEPHWASAEGGPPPPQFEYRAPGEAAGGVVEEEFIVAYGGSGAHWRWDGSSWLRSQRGTEHRLVSGEQVSAANVVIIEAQRLPTGMVDASGGTVPEFLFVGSGAAVVYSDGRRTDGSWTKPTLTSVATLTDAADRPIALTPGRTWIQLVEARFDSAALTSD